MSDMRKVNPMNELEFKKDTLMLFGSSGLTMRC